MALPPSYDRRFVPQTARLPGVVPGASGEAIAQGLGAIAGAVDRDARLDRDAAERIAQAEHETRMIELNRQRDAMTADAAVAAAELETELRAHEAEALAAMPAGGEGVEKQLADWREERTAKFLDTLSDDKVRQRFLPVVARIRGDSTLRVQTAVIGARAEKSGQDWERLTATQANAVRTDLALPLADAFEPVRLFIEAQQLPADKRAEMERGAFQQMTIARMQGAIDADPNAAIELLRSDKLDAVLEPRQRDALINNAHVEINRLRVEADRVDAERVAQEKEEEATALLMVNRGGDYDAARLEAMAARAEARGDTSRAAELRMAKGTVAVTAPYREALPAQITDALARIEAKDGWRDDPAQIAAHKALTELRTERRNAEPNIAPPDMADPGSVAAYERAVNADAAARGTRPRYLSRDMLALLEPMMKEPQGRTAVLNQLGGFSEAARFAAARQLAPEDAVFQLASTLDGRARALALAGREALPQVKDTGVAAGARTAFRREALAALRGFEPDFGAAVQEGALAIYATMLQNAGKTGWDQSLYDKALTMALGGSDRGGGIGRWRGQPIVLPGDIDQKEFDRRFSRLSGLANAYDADGRRLTFDQLRRSFQLVTVGDGLYHFQDSRGRPIRARDGTPALLDVKRLR